MKTNRTLQIVALALCMIFLPYSCAFANPNAADGDGNSGTVTEYYSEDFSAVTAVEQVGCYGGKPAGPEETYAIIDNGALWFGKSVTGKGASTLTLNFDAYLNGSATYKVSYDLVSAVETAGATVNMVIGGRYFCIRSAGGGKCTIEWHDGSSWITTDTKEFDFSKGKNISLVVKEQSTVDLYIGGVIYKENLPFRSTSPYTDVWFILGNGLKGKIGIDNIVVTDDLTVTPQEPDTPEDLPENAVSSDDVPPLGAPTVGKDEFDLYLAIGQSNMAGRAPIETQDRFFIPNAYLLNSTDNWERAQVQFVNGKWCGMNRYSTVQKENSIQGVNPSLYFAKKLSETVCDTGRKIGIIGNARGDTNIAQWQKGYSGNNDFDLFEEAVRRAKAAAESGTLKGIIWHQGCGDITTDADAYVQQFAQFVSDIRKELGNSKLPIFIGEIPGFADSEQKQALRRAFNEIVIPRLASTVRYCYVISSSGAGHIGDYTHFDAATQRMLGERYADSVIKNIYESSQTVDASVSFDGVGDTATIKLGENPTLTLSAEAQSGIEKIDIYANDKLFTTLSAEPYLVDFSSLPGGKYTVKAVATAADGTTAQATLQLTLTASAQNVIFEDSEFLQTLPGKYDSGILAYSQRGYVKTDTMDAKHGTSLIVGIEKVNEDYSIGSLPYINIPLGGLDDKFSICADMFVSGKENSGDKKFSIYQASGNEVVLISFGDMLNVLGKTIDYETQKWYSFQIDVDMRSSAVQVYCNGELTAAENISKNLKTANYLRLYGPRNDTVPSYTAIDNIKVTKAEEIPSVVSVNGGNAIENNKTQFDFTFSEPIGDLKKEDVSIFDKFGVEYACAALELSDDKMTATVTLSAVLPTGRDYDLIIGEGMKLASGAAAGSRICASFATKSAVVAISSVGVSDSGGKKQVRVTVENGGEDAVVVAVVSLWKDSVYLGMSARELSIPATSSQFADFNFAVNDDTVVETVLYTNLSSPIMIGDGIIKNR